MKIGKHGRESLKSRRQRLIEAGEEFSRKELAVGYVSVAGCCAIAGISMQLRWPFLLVGILLCAMRVPQLYYQHKKMRYEWRCFQDVNAYMAQMVQSFAVNGKIITSLRETRDTFPRGFLRNLLTKAVCHMEESQDVELSQREGLGFLAAQYDCERIRTLHDFLLKAESRGGSCEMEFRLLETIRQMWERSELSYQNGIRMARNLVAFEYGFLIVICIFMLHQFPEELQILHLPLVQGLNTFLIVCFFVVYGRLNRRLCKGMLGEEKSMDVGQVRRRMSCVQEFQEAKVHPVWRSLRYFWNMRLIKAEIKRAFPGWLFDVLLLMQSENVAMAIAKSAEKAPPALKEELQRMQKELQECPQSAEAFLTFLAVYQIPEVEGIMRKLYALNLGCGAPTEMMEMVIETNMRMLAESESRKRKNQGDLLSIYYVVPTIPVMICMVGYGIALMFVIFNNIMSVI